jgi:hypothetical protein
MRKFLRVVLLHVIDEGKNSHRRKQRLGLRSSSRKVG